MSVLTVLLVNDSIIQLSLHIFLYALVANLLIMSLIKSHATHTEQAFGIVLQIIILMVHIYIVYGLDKNLLYRVISVALLMLSVTIDYYILKHRDVPFVFSTVGEDAISFEDIKHYHTKIVKKSNLLEQAGKVFTPNTVKELAKEFSRHSSIRYVNKSALSKEYFEHLDESLSDLNVYIVLSDTGSPASDVIGLFTQKPFNHASISFDPELKTLVSYNGGARLTPPGLNAEMLQHFCQKEGAAIRVYRLAVTLEQKKGMVERVKKIDREGSAYNLLGLALRRSMKPNIMFCSQFVYNLLLTVGAQYFEENPDNLKPTDLIELDYDRKLEFVENILLS